MKTLSTPHAMPHSPSTLDNLPVAFTYDRASSRTHHRSDHHRNSTICSSHPCSEKYLRARVNAPRQSQPFSPSEAPPSGLSWIYLHPQTPTSFTSRANTIRDADIITVVPIVPDVSTYQESRPTYRIIHLAASSRGISSSSTSRPVPPLQVTTTHATDLPRSFLRRHATNLLPPYLAQLLDGCSRADASSMNMLSGQFGDIAMEDYDSSYYAKAGSCDAAAAANAAATAATFHVVIEDSRTAKRAWRDVVQPVLAAMGLLTCSGNGSTIDQSISVTELSQHHRSGRSRNPIRDVASTIAIQCATSSSHAQRISVLCIGSDDVARDVADAVSEVRARASTKARSSRSSKSSHHHTTEPEIWTAPWLGRIRTEGSSSSSMSGKPHAHRADDGASDLRARKWSERAGLVTDLRAYLGMRT